MASSSFRSDPAEDLISSLQDTVRDLERNEDELTNKVNELEGWRAFNDGQLKELRKSEAAKDGEIAAKTEEIAAKDEEIKRLHGLLRQREKEISQLQQQINVYSRDLEQLRQSIRCEQSTVQNLQKHISNRNLQEQHSVHNPQARISDRNLREHTSGQNLEGRISDRNLRDQSSVQNLQTRISNPNVRQQNTNQEQDTQQRMAAEHTQGTRRRSSARGSHERQQQHLLDRSSQAQRDSSERALVLRPSMHMTRYPAQSSDRQLSPSPTERHRRGMGQATRGRRTATPYRQAPPVSSQATISRSSGTRDNSDSPSASQAPPPPFLLGAEVSHGEYEHVFKEVADFARQWTASENMSKTRAAEELEGAFRSYTSAAFFPSLYHSDLRHHFVARYLFDALATRVWGLSLFANHPATDAKQDLRRVGQELRTRQSGPPLEARELLRLAQQQATIAAGLAAHEGHTTWVGREVGRTGSPVLEALFPALKDEDAMRDAFVGLWFDAIHCSVALWSRPAVYSFSAGCKWGRNAFFQSSQHRSVDERAAHLTPQLLEARDYTVQMAVAPSVTKKSFREHTEVTRCVRLADVLVTNEEWPQPLSRRQSRGSRSQGTPRSMETRVATVGEYEW